LGGRSCEQDGTTDQQKQDQEEIPGPGI